MPPGEASLGLTEVLCGHGDDELKGAAVDGLVALGGLAEPDLVVTLDDPEGGDWARAALEQIRFEREHPGAGDRGRRTPTTGSWTTRTATPATGTTTDEPDGRGRRPTRTPADEPRPRTTLDGARMQ